MTTPSGPGASTSSLPRSGSAGERSFFEQQRAGLVSEISLAMEHVLMNLNTLNRSMEGVIAVGREFEAVEALWSEFESVMGRDPGAEKAPAEGEGAGESAREDSS